MRYVGQPVSRVDGPAKVTGKARYAAEFTAPDLAYGVVVCSTIARGRITRIDDSEARAVEGVVEVFTHENRSGTALLDRNWRDQVAPPGSPFRPLHDAEIRYNGQPIALIVAGTFEAARFAASLLRVTYAEAAHETDFEQAKSAAYVPKKKRAGIAPPPPPRGGADAASAHASARVTHDYETPTEHHNPMEPHATTVIWDGGGRITVYDKTQGVQNVQDYIVGVFGIARKNVRVVSPFVGGAFGSALRPNYQLFLAVAAAQALKRSVRVVMTRQQMFTAGYRPASVNTISLGADSDGKLTSIAHQAISPTSRSEDYQENVVNWSGLLYACDNVALTYKLAGLDVFTPCDMRAPGATQGVFALETAMDELAYELGVDPLTLRLTNYAERDLNEGKAFTSKALRACYEQGAERFGWSRRSAAPRSMREGRELIGWGMATGVWEALHMPTSARATLHPGARLELASAVADIGTGTYTIVAQLAAEALGLRIEDVTVKLSDSALPTGPVEGGSWTAASLGAAVQAACDSVRKELVAIGRGIEGSPLRNTDVDHVEFVDGVIRLKGQPGSAIGIDAVLQASGRDAISAEETVGPNPASAKAWSRYTHSAVFAEVRIDDELNVVRVTRMVSAIAAGRILNTKTARSQIMGGMVWGIGMALHEETVTDHRIGRFMNRNFGEYHIPVNADVHDIDVIFVDEPDAEVSPLGVKGVGEIGLVGAAAAIGNAIFHATGKRIRDLPITMDKLMRAPA